MQDHVDAALLPGRMGAALVGGLATVGVLLAMVGLYGLITHGVSLRTGEIGLRMALGSTPWGILRLVLRESVLLMAAGAAIGLVVAFVLSVPLAPLMAFGVETSDPASYVQAVSILLAIGVLASLVPASRAMLLDPARALRQD